VDNYPGKSTQDGCVIVLRRSMTMICVEKLAEAFSSLVSGQPSPVQAGEVVKKKKSRNRVKQGIIS